MIYQSEIRITTQELEEGRTTKDDLARQVMMRIVHELPMEVLEKMFKVTHKDPRFIVINDTSSRKEITEYRELSESMTCKTTVILNTTWL